MFFTAFYLFNFYNLVILTDFIGLDDIGKRGGRRGIEIVAVSERIILFVMINFWLGYNDDGAFGLIFEPIFMVTAVSVFYKLAESFNEQQEEQNDETENYDEPH